MKEVSRVIRDNGNGTRRCVQTLTGGIRRVVVDYRGESWHSYLIIPRDVIIAGIRRRRAQGRQYHDCDWWQVLPGLERWIASVGHGGPGRAFAHEPSILRRCRRFLVIAQCGGLDI